MTRYPDVRADGIQSEPGAFSERLGAHPVEHLVGDGQLDPGVGRTVAAGQPFAVQEPGASTHHADLGLVEAIDRLLVRRLGGDPVRDHGTHTRRRAQGPRRTAGPAQLDESLDRVGRARPATGAYGGRDWSGGATVTRPGRR
ncbi:hypothetical protein [Kribbella sp. NPDC000426]|uniref:hypothetical protein n=1 Tax=Kribbella sp. NPDC000426 TaxID=3154255 RepID=UPI00333470CF